MNEYKKSLWASNIVILLFAISLTFAIKLTFNPLFQQQQELIAQKLNLRAMQIISKETQFNKLIDYNLFNYIKVSNSKLAMPLVYQNKQLDISTYLLPIAATRITSQNGNQSIEFKGKNSRELTLFKNIMLLIYGCLLIATLCINIIYYRVFNTIETALIQELSDEDTTTGPFPHVSEQLSKHQQIFHRALQNQEQQILSLARQVNLDNLTGLNNRHAFRRELTAILTEQSEAQHAILFILRASELNSINAQRGFQQGDQYIINIASMMRAVSEQFPGIAVYRISGSDLAIIAREMNISDAQRLAKKLKIEFDQYQILHKLDSIAYIGISAIVSGQLPEQVLAKTDMALAKAQGEGVNSWVFEPRDSQDNQLGQQHWHQIIDNIISKRALMLLHQPIQAIHPNMKGYQQIFTRFIGENNNRIPSDTVFAMAQRVDKVVELEKLILETIISQCRQKADGSKRWGIHISSAAMQNSSFIIWLERLLLREPNIAAALIFEMQEQVLDSNLVASKRIFDMLKRSGTRSAICNFGKGIGSFRLFKELRPDFVKIDASLIRHIERDNANQQFVRMIIDVSHRMDCRVIAEGIEHLEQKQTLENMYIDGVQGFLIARPSPL